MNPVEDMIIEGRRLKQFRLFCNCSREVFAKTLELQQGSYSNLENGRRSLTYHSLKVLVFKFSLNPIWFITGEGDLIFEKDKPLKKSEDQDIKYELQNENQELKQYIDSLEKNVQVSQWLIEAYEKKSSSNITT